jgi:hypothetical protein
MGNGIWLEMRRSLIDLYGVCIEVTIKGKESLLQLFPTLYSLPRSVNDTIDWRIKARCTKNIPTHSFEPSRPTSVLRIHPDTEVVYRIDEDSSLSAFLEGASLRMNPGLKAALLEYRPNAITDAEQMARLAVIEILRREKLYTIHAGAVEYKGRAALICASSGMGKSTLTAAWAYLGSARFMADDQCVLFERAGSLWIGGVSSTLALLPKSEEILTSLGVQLPSTDKRFEQKSLFTGQDFFIQVCPDPYPVKAVFFLVDGSVCNDRICTCPHELAGKLLLKSSFFVGESQIMREHFKTILDLTVQAQMYLVPSGIDCHLFLSQIENLLEESPPLAVPLYPRPQRRAPNAPIDRILRATKGLCQLVSRPEITQNEAVLIDQDLIDLAKVADHHGLFALLGKILEKVLNLEDLRPDLRNAIEIETWHASTARRTHLSIIKTLAEVFRSKGLEWSIINGPSIAERFYQFPETRFYHKLELAVAPETAKAVKTVMEEIGYAALAGCGTADGGRIDFIAETLSQYRIQIYTHDAALGAVRRETANAMDALLSRSEILQVEDTTMPVASLCDQIVLACIQSSNGFQWHNLMFLLDLVLMAKHAPAREGDRIRETADRLGYLNVVALALGRAAFFFPSAASLLLMQSLSPSPYAKILGALVDPKATFLQPGRPSMRFRRSLFRMLIEKGVV